MDRYYIERFLDSHRTDVRGQVLGIAERTYPEYYGEDRVEVSDILAVDATHPDATVFADLTAADNVDDDRFDCIICVQTLQFTYTFMARSGICTRPPPRRGAAPHHPGVSQLDASAVDLWGEWWLLTSRSTRVLLEVHFEPADIDVQAHGNVLAATSLLYSITVQELKPRELDAHDLNYEVLITARAVKRAPARD